METIWEIIVEVIILIIFRYPGALIRWVFTGCRRPFKEVLQDDGYINGMLGLVVVASLIVLLVKYL